ncbi:Transcription factor ACEII [Paramyrothecium foliicola]|nr:Transcription factor ACEII [Paramyrothecium foliicola]
MAADLRQACDRCHDKKLRCPRPAGSLSCSRCAKAGASCIFSPPTRPTRSGPASDDRHALGSAVGSAVGSAAAGRVFPAAQLVTSVNHVPQESASIEPLQRHKNVSSDSSHMERLTETMLALDRLVHQLPPPEVHHVPTDMEVLLRYANSVGDRYQVDRMLEAVLDHAQRLAHLHPIVIDHALHNLNAPDPEASCTITGCVHRMHDNSALLPDAKIDYAILNLLMACELRLLDLLDTLIRDCRKCQLCVSLLIPLGYGPKLAVPEVRIGSVVASKATASSMVVSAIFEALIAMLSNSKDMAARLGEAASQTSREVKVLQLQCDIVKDRTQTTFAEVLKLRDELVAIGLLT